MRNKKYLDSINKAKALEITEELPKLPVARVLWKPLSYLYTALWKHGYLQVDTSYLVIVKTSAIKKLAKTSIVNMKNIQISHYGVTAKGDSIKKYTLTNKNGMKVEIINFGGIITSLTAPDKNGKYEDVVLGFTKPEDYFNGNPYYFGALIGRYANRIANSRFILEDKTYEIDKNEDSNSLHGGKEGFHTKFWNIMSVEEAEFPTLRLTYESEDGEQGYPGKLMNTVLYTLTDDDSFEISYEATTDKTTVVNLTQHTYFNLSGNFTKAITDHELKIEADKFLPVDEAFIPTGEQEVRKTPFDFTISKAIGKDINSDDDQLKKGNGGYDHNWILNGSGLRNVAEVYHPETGRLLEVFTDQPGIQFYSGNSLDGKFETKTGGKCGFRTGLCLETQHFPDSPNQASFPSAKLKPGQKYQTKTIYKFSIKK